MAGGEKTGEKWVKKQEFVTSSPPSPYRMGQERVSCLWNKQEEDTRKTKMTLIPLQ